MLVPLDLEREVPFVDCYAVVDEIVDLARALARVRLTAREREAVLLAARGYNGRDSAAIMGVDPSRVTGLRRSAGRKLAA